MEQNFSYLMKRVCVLILMTIAGTAIYAQTGTLESRLRANIYLNVYANKTNCYVGEPIIVTYKLYSSLESVSEIVKDPVFDGFDFRDLNSSGDGSVSRETVNGETFDVHTLRKVQLTPLETGSLRLDQMVVNNRIKLVDGNGNRSSILDGLDDNIPLRNGEYRMSISSVPITINVTDAPANSRPTVYNGAVGDFKMSVRLSKVNFNPGERGTLQIVISGSGDFSQVTQPEVAFPKDVTVYPGNVQEQYDRTNKAGPGVKTFTIPFTVGKTGTYTIMPIQFSYFDSRQNRYNVITNPPTTFYSREPGARAVGPAANNPATGDDDWSTNWGIVLVGLGIVALMVVLIMLAKMARKKRHGTIKPQTVPIQVQQPQAIITQPVANPALSADVLLHPAEEALAKPGTSFYTALKQAMVQFFEQKYHVSSLLFNKTALKDAFAQNNIANAQQDELFNTLTEIEMNIYSAGGMDGDRARLLEKVRNIMRQL